MAKPSFERRHLSALAQGPQETFALDLLDQKLLSVSLGNPDCSSSQSIHQPNIVTTSIRVGACALAEEPSGQETPLVSSASTIFNNPCARSSETKQSRTETQKGYPVKLDYEDTEPAKRLVRKTSYNSVSSSQSSSFQSAKSFHTAQSRKISQKSLQRLPSFLGRYHSEQKSSPLSRSFSFASTRELHSTAWNSTRFRSSSLATLGIPARTASLGDIQETNHSRKVETRSVSVSSFEELSELLSVHNEPLFIDLAKRVDREFIFPATSSAYIEAASPPRHRTYRSASYDTLGRVISKQRSDQASTPLIYKSRSSANLHCRKIREPVFVPKTILKNRDNTSKLSYLSIGDATVEEEEGSSSLGHQMEATNGTTGAVNGGSADTVAECRDSTHPGQSRAELHFASKFEGIFLPYTGDVEIQNSSDTGGGQDTNAARVAHRKQRNCKTVLNSPSSGKETGDPSLSRGIWSKLSSFIGRFKVHRLRKKSKDTKTYNALSERNMIRSSPLTKRKMEARKPSEV